MTNAAPDVDHAAAEEPAIALSADGKRLALVRGGVLTIDGVRGAVQGHVVAATLLDREVWCVTRDAAGHRLERVGFDGEQIAAATPLGPLGDAIRITSARGGMHGLVTGERVLELRATAGRVEIAALGARTCDARILLPGRGVLERRGASLVLMRAGRVAELSLAIPVELAHGVVRDGALLLDGAMVAVELVVRGQHVLLVYDARRGTLQSRVRISDAALLAVAERAGVVVIGRDRHLALLELRGGRCRCERVLAAPVASVAIDAAAERVVVVDVLGRVTELGLGLSDREAQREEEAEGLACGESTDAESDVKADAVTASAVVETDDVLDAKAAAAVVVADANAVIDAKAAAAVVVTDGNTVTERRADADAVFVPSKALTDAVARVLVGLGPIPYPALTDEMLARYLDDLRGWIVALCTGAAVRNAGPAEAIAGARAGEDAATRRLLAWSRRGAPHVELAQELKLSTLGTSLLILIAAPQIWGELARDYGMVTADRARPLVDELLLAHLLDAGTQARSDIATELDDDAPLVASGAVVVAAGLRPYAQLSVHPAIARRIAGAHVAGDPAGAPCALDDIIGADAELAALADQLAAPAAAPKRIVLRGRAGSGRRTIAAAFAAQAGRALRLIAVESGADADRKLRQALRDATLRGDLPCVSLDELSTDPGLHRPIRSVLDAHPAPLFVRAPLDGELPLAEGHAVVDLPALTATQRSTMWRRSLAAHGLDATAADALATRFRVGPGGIARACAAVGRADPSQRMAAIAATVAQQRSSRIRSIASRVTQLAAWGDLVVSDEIADSLRELVARVEHQRTVHEAWGMSRVAATARGITALFQGGPGTGKTMAAGVIAHALGYELWRVDLSKIVSKWIGETEKNLARVFDAAEDGEVVLLFDEADSLFGKRTDVKTGNDRNANLETNYLLQRLDSFTGIAILTTNFGTAIDAAFKRRLTVQVQFPFPDETEREQLWRAHLPPELPVSGDLDLGGLARRYELSGGYIRNTALRAAYLAAADRTPLTQGHLERAIKAVYRDQAKVTTGGRME